MNAVNAFYFVGPDYQIGPDGLSIHAATGNVKFRYDVINLELGQFLNFGTHVDMRFFAGLSTGFLREETTATYTGATPPPFAGPFSTTQDMTSNFTGVGPRLGIHFDIDPGWYGLGLLGEAGVSTLVGTMDSKAIYTSSAAELLAVFGQTVNTQIIKDQAVYQIIPGFDAKLGVTWKHSFMHDTVFTLSAGYQAAVYVNAISQYVPGTLAESLTTGGIFVDTMAHTLSNYSVQGPFLNFALAF